LYSNNESIQGWLSLAKTRSADNKYISNLQEIKEVRGEKFQIPDYIAHELQMESASSEWDLTAPGYNYMGPGTKVVSNILRKKRARDDLDEIALHHDLDMLQAHNIQDMKVSDADAIMLSKESVSYQSNPLGKLMLENLLGKGLGPKPKPKPRVFNYLNTLHQLDELEVEKSKRYKTHKQTTLAKEAVSTLYEQQYYAPEPDEYELNLVDSEESLTIEQPPNPNAPYNPHGYTVKPFTDEDYKSIFQDKEVEEQNFLHSKEDEELYVNGFDDLRL